ncbi:MAG: type II toxin-antitoxin system PemK/MazF family toxin [Candidatus Limnocylindria bacterium]
MPRGTEHGEIWWAAADKKRPVVVVSRDDPRGARTLATVASITTTARGLASEVELDQRDGLPRPCVANCDDLTTIAKVRLIQRVGRLSEVKLMELDEALRFALQLG